MTPTAPATLFGQLADPTWWVDVADRAARQAVQVLLPLLLLGATTGAVDVKSAAAAGVAAVVAFLVVVVRALTGLRADPDAPAGAQVVDRVVSAAAAAVLAFLTADGFDVLTADAGAIATAAGLSAVTALAQWFLQRPANIDPAA